MHQPAIETEVVGRWVVANDGGRPGMGAADAKPSYHIRVRPIQTGLRDHTSGCRK
jgi:hypothetical protein